MSTRQIVDHKTTLTLAQWKELALKVNPSANFAAVNGETFIEVGDQIALGKFSLADGHCSIAAAETWDCYEAA